MNAGDNKKRSIAKTVSYRILIIIANGVTIYILTGRMDLTTGFTVLSTVVNTLLYYFNERVWNRVGWGKQIKK